jgi:hypothetical protein
MPAEARLLGAALQGKAALATCQIEGAGGAGEPVGESATGGRDLGIGTNNASLGRFLHRATGRALPLRGRCLQHSVNHIWVMCGRIIQSSAPIRYAIVDGMNVRDSRVANYPPRWNGAPSQDLLVIRRNHQTSEVPLDPLRRASFPIGDHLRRIGQLEARFRRDRTQIQDWPARVIFHPKRAVRPQLDAVAGRH